MTDRYAVIGNPVAHSKSPQIHAAFARHTGEDIEYTRLHAPLDGFRASVAAFRAEGGKGLNVTLPFKLEALQITRETSARARLAGAANFLRVTDSGWYADNTDGAGLMRDLEFNLGFKTQGRRLLLIGAGGAARGVIGPLLAANPASLALINRTPQTANDLVRALAPHHGNAAVTAGGLASVAGSQFDLVINATSSSISGTLPALPEGLFAAGSLAYDMMYAADATPFMRFALEQGAGRAADGSGMLVEQAAESFFLWRGVRPETAGVLDELRRAA